MRHVERSWVPMLLLGLVLGGYAYRLQVPSREYFDEHYYVAWARDLIQLRGPGQMTHPLFGCYFISLGILLGGDHPVAWRTFPVLAGVGCVAVLYQLARTLTGSARIALLAALFFSLDGLVLTQARLGITTSIMLFFQLLSLWPLAAYLRDRQYKRGRALMLSGVCLGLALATKWIAVLTAGLLGLVVVKLLLEATDRSRLVRQSIVALVLVPLLVYVGVQLPMIWLEGEGFGEFWKWQQVMLHYHGTIYQPHPYQSSWWSWPLLLRPIWLMAWTTSKSRAGILCLGNPALFWAMPLAFGYLAWRVGRTRSVSAGFILAGFACHWLPWALVRRVTYFTHFYSAMPFVCLALAAAVDQLWEWRAAGRWLAVAYVVLVVGLFVFWYPLLTAEPVSEAFVRWHVWLPSWQWPLSQ